jgi:hypothetical protein
MPYRIRGVVRERETGRPLAGLVVRGYDRDLLKDDPLGEVRTGAEGAFELVFTEVQFMDLHETRPDVYVEIFDAGGVRRLHSTADAVRRDVVGDVYLEVELPRALLGGGVGC